MSNYSNTLFNHVLSFSDEEVRDVYRLLDNYIKKGKTLKVEIKKNNKKNKNRNNKINNNVMTEEEAKFMILKKFNKI